jgi:DNA-binding SARP family transcriptional activator
MQLPRLEVRLLGRIDARIAGEPVRVGGRHAQALLALLALDPRPRSREVLAIDLWPDNPTATASLRQALWHLRSALVAAGADPDAYIEADGETIGLVPGAPVETDVARFETLARGRARDPEAAVALYGGDLADGFGHECFVAERERLADIYEDTLGVIAEQRLAAGSVDEARATAELLLARDQLREEAHAVLIAVHARSGSRAQIVRQYRRLAAVLRRELDVEPLPETQEIYRRALASVVESSRQRLASQAFGGRAVRAARRPLDVLTAAPSRGLLAGQRSATRLSALV